MLLKHRFCWWSHCQVLIVYSHWLFNNKDSWMILYVSKPKFWSIVLIIKIKEWIKLVVIHMDGGKEAEGVRIMENNVLSTIKWTTMQTSVTQSMTFRHGWSRKLITRQMWLTRKRSMKLKEKVLHEVKLLMNKFSRNWVLNNYTSS